MGNCAGQKEVKLVLIGLDMAGKTSLLNRLCHSDAGTTTPTVGFNFESTMYKNVRVSFWDTGGQDKIRDLWKHYYEEVDGVLYVVDSTDENRLEESKEALHKALHDINLQNAFLCVLVNKYDLGEKCISSKEIESKLDLSSLPQSRLWTILEVSALKGTGLQQMLAWVSKQKTKK